MGGRGRGRATSSFTQEQLQTLGCVGKDLQTIDRTLVPPPLFPMLPTKPVALDVRLSIFLSISSQFAKYPLFLEHFREAVQGAVEGGFYCIPQGFSVFHENQDSGAESAAILRCLHCKKKFVGSFYFWQLITGRNLIPG